MIRSITRLILAGSFALVGSLVLTTGATAAGDKPVSPATDTNDKPLHRMEIQNGNVSSFYDYYVLPPGVKAGKQPSGATPAATTGDGKPLRVHVMELWNGLVPEVTVFVVPGSEIRPASNVTVGPTRLKVRVGASEYIGTFAGRDAEWLMLNTDNGTARIRLRDISSFEDLKKK
jgi:hypothetical protein